jgi:hypothetical protein
MRETPWSVLGIEPTTDERAIKRAYSSLLKVTSPEKDPAGYMKLREAYEQAKQHIQMQEYLARLQEEPPAEEQEEPSRFSFPAPPTDTEPAVESPQQRAFAELNALLAQGQADAFLEKLAAVLAEDTFSTLDEQYFFAGEVARLVQEFKIENVEWCGRVAELLGAREHENIFDGDPRYWHAYQALLRCYSESLATRTRAHLDQDTGEVSPGYLHVYHVLTSPFDAERLSALTRRQGYLRLAELILERAKIDSSIVIPAENREWWERTAMAGHHKPVAEPASFTITDPVPMQTQRKFPFWALWAFFIVLAQLARFCSSSPTSASVTSRELQPYVRSEPLNIHQEALRLRQELDDQSAEQTLNRRLAACDRDTRETIRAHVYVTQANKRFEQSSGATANWLTPAEPRSLSDPPAAAQLPLDESDPVIASLLDKCQAARFFDDEGRLTEMPGSR